MFKVNANDHAKVLIRANGAGKALRIARGCMDGTSPTIWTQLPVGPVFHSKPYGKDGWILNNKELVKRHAFWSQVYHIILKGVKNHG